MRIMSEVCTVHDKSSTEEFQGKMKFEDVKKITEGISDVEGKMSLEAFAPNDFYCSIQ
mgnify:CR=1 FL=1